MSVLQKAGSVVWIIDKIKQVVEAAEIVQNATDPAKREQAAYDAATKLAEAVGIGIPLWFIDKAVTKTGLDRVFDSLRKNKAFEEYLKDQVAQKNLRDFGLGNLAEWGLKELRDWISRNGYLDPVFDLVTGRYGNAQTWVQRRDPLTLDLDGDGLETVGINAANPILFDHDGDGVKNATGWIQPDDGFLVLDRNGDGLINDGTELFGDSTPVFDADGNVVRKAVDGFDALAQEDTNGDGLVNNQDANWASLRVWQDANSDGISQANEHTALLDTSAVPLSVAQRIKCTKSCTTRNIRRPHGNFSQRRDSPFTGSRQLF